MKLSDKEQQMLQDRIEDLISKKISLDVLGNKNSKTINNDSIQLLPNDKFEYLSN